MPKPKNVSREDIFAKIESLASSPVAVQALWDGDSRGWHVYLAAITSDGGVHHLGTLFNGGDIVTTEVRYPLWDVAVAAQKIGEELEKRYGVEFYFPSPNYPEDDCPEWKDRDKGYPCRCCGILLRQRDSLPWHGLCFHCHLDEEHELKEAQWTIEQLQGPRCYVCGTPATGELNGHPVCADHFDQYEIYQCEQCKGVGITSKASPPIIVCSTCQLKNTINSLTQEQRKTILEAMDRGDLHGIKAIKDTLECSLNDAVSIMSFLENESPEE